MAHLWVSSTEGDWTVESFDSEPMRDAAATNGYPIGGSDSDQAAAVIFRVEVAHSEAWILMTGSPSVSVNGVPVTAGIRVLVDRDEICTRGRRQYFSTEQLAQVSPFPGANHPTLCPRCRQAVEAGTAAVRCPGCGLWHHQTEELPCWTYADTCASCPQPTDLEAGFRWTPNGNPR